MVANYGACRLSDLYCKWIMSVGGFPRAQKSFTIHRGLYISVHVISSDAQRDWKGIHFRLIRWIPIRVSCSVTVSYLTGQGSHVKWQGTVNASRITSKFTKFLLQNFTITAKHTFSQKFVAIRWLSTTPSEVSNLLQSGKLGIFSC